MTSTQKIVNGELVVTTITPGANITLNTNVVDVRGNVLADFFIGDGRFLTNVTGNVAGAAQKIINGSTQVDIPVPSGNVIFDVAGSIGVMDIGATAAFYVGNFDAGLLSESGVAVLNVNDDIDGGTY